VSLARWGKRRDVPEKDRKREEAEPRQPAVLPEREAISILFQTSHPDDRDEQEESEESRRAS
jgi:hypothetical protein